MPAESAEMTFDAEQFGDFETPEYASSYESINAYEMQHEAHVESAQNDNEAILAGANDNDPSAERFESLDVLTQSLIDYKGGNAEDWKSEYRGEGFTYDGQFVRNEQGEVWPHADGEMLRQWSEGQGNLFRLPDHEVQSGDEVTLFVTHIMRNQDDSVRYEIHSTTYRRGGEVESNPLNDWKYLDAMPSVLSTEALYDIEPEEAEEAAPLQALEATAEATETSTSDTEISAPLEIPEVIAAIEIAEAETEISTPVEEAVTEYSYASVLQSLENLAVYHFQDEEADHVPEPIIAPASVAEFVPAPVRAEAQPQAVFATPTPEAPASIEVLTPRALIEEKSPQTIETEQPVKPAETIIGPTRATEVPAEPVAEQIVASPALEVPQIASANERMQAAVQELLREDISLDTFFAPQQEAAQEAPIQQLAVSEPVAVEVIVPVREATADSEPTAVAPPTAAEAVSTISPVVTEGTRVAHAPEPTREEIEEPVFDAAPEISAIAANDNERAAERFAPADTQDMLSPIMGAETLQARKFSGLSEEDVLPTPSNTNQPQRTSRNGITIEIAA